MSSFEIKVKNLPEKINKETLLKMFEKYGEVLRCTERLQWGGAFIAMKRDIEGEKAVNALNGMEIDGKKLFVQKKGGKPSSSKGNQTVVSRSGGTDGYFINPYNFIPVTEVKQSDETIREYYSENSHFQDRFRKGAVSGRVVCEVETESAMFIGGGKAQEYDDQTKTPAKLVPFSLNGEPAIPPSTIKGMLSSVMEAASNSALRVLERKAYTRRMKASGESFSKIGILRIQGNDYHIEVLPDDYIYLNSYSYNDRRSMFTASGTLANTSLKDYSVDPVFYYAHNSEIRPARKRRYSHPSLTAACDSLISQDAYDGLSPPQERQYTKGILKHFGVVGRDRDDDIPHRKYHEIFIKYPRRGTYIGMLPRAIEEFNELARDAHDRDKRMPFSPFERHTNPGRPIKLRDGDVLYYRTIMSRGTVYADKVSFSAIWRDFCGGTKQNNDAYGYFKKKKVDKNGFLLPPCLINQDGKEPEDLRLTPVCSLMGFVEEQKHPDQESAFALAGRLFFSPGILAPGQDPAQIRHPEKALKELASPKPPCPEFYFHRKAGTGSSPFITKEELEPNGDYIPNGRKFYWHHLDENDPYAPDDAYAKDRYKRVVRINPIKKGVKFLFSIDFFNLTEFELGMLLYAVRPTETFRHRIGMGKPIGLGRIRIDILNLLFVNRQRRYGDDNLFDSTFFHSQTDTDTKRINEINKPLKDESSDQQNERDRFQKQRYFSVASDPHQQDIEYFRNEFKGKIKLIYGDNWLVPLESMGDPGSTEGHNVRYPPDPNDPGGHDEAFKWWVRNAGKDKDEYGHPIPGLKKPLPALSDVPSTPAPTLPVDPRG